jgi:hypothetical protein
MAEAEPQTKTKPEMDLDILSAKLADNTTEINSIEREIKERLTSKQLHEAYLKNQEHKATINATNRCIKSKIEKLEEKVACIKKEIIEKSNIRGKEPNFNISRITSLETQIEQFKSQLEEYSYPYPLLETPNWNEYVYIGDTDRLSKKLFKLQKQYRVINKKISLVKQVIEEDKWRPAYEYYAQYYDLDYDEDNLFEVCNYHRFERLEAGIEYRKKKSELIPPKPGDEDNTEDEDGEDNEDNIDDDTDIIEPLVCTCGVEYSYMDYNSISCYTFDEQAQQHVWRGGRCSRGTKMVLLINKVNIKKLGFIHSFDIEDVATLHIK